MLYSGCKWQRAVLEVLLRLATKCNCANLNAAPTELETFLFFSLFTFLEFFDGFRVLTLEV